MSLSVPPHLGNTRRWTVVFVLGYRLGSHAVDVMVDVLEVPLVLVYQRLDRQSMPVRLLPGRRRGQMGPLNAGLDFLHARLSVVCLFLCVVDRILQRLQSGRQVDRLLLLDSCIPASRQRLIDLFLHYLQSAVHHLLNESPQTGQVVGAIVMRNRRWRGSFVGLGERAAPGGAR